MFTNKLTFEKPADKQDHDHSQLLSDRVIPKDLRLSEIYGKWMLSNELSLFAQTSQKAFDETAFIRLLYAAIHAEPESYQQNDETKLAAIAILKRQPGLLFIKGMVTDHVGRRIAASPYQLFLGAGDIWALKKVHDEIMPNIEDSETKAQTQFKEQFPNCLDGFDPNLGEEQLYDDRNISQVEQIKERLKNLVNVIAVDPCVNGFATLDETEKAVAELCQLFAPIIGDVIHTGLHFPLAIIQEIFKVYDAQFVPWSGSQLSFFSREVIGAVLATSSVVDGQCFKLGLSNLTMRKGPDRRDGLFCAHPMGIPKELAPIRGRLAREMFVDPYDGFSCFLGSSFGVFNWYNKFGVIWSSGVRLGAVRHRGVGELLYKTYGNQKIQAMGSIMNSQTNSSIHCLDHGDQSKRCVLL